MASTRGRNPGVCRDQIICTCTETREYYRQFPACRGRERVTFCFDEIQVVGGWERFARRMLDEENVELFLSGSSAKMLSREVATSMRGRALETVISPFSFREFLRHRGVAVPAPDELLGPRQRSLLTKQFDDYVEIGGFPEAQAVTEARDRVPLLQGYVDAVLLRDIVERYRVSNLPALRAMVRQFLRNPAALFSISRLSKDLRSQGIAVSKETLLEFLGYLQDSFLVTAAPVASRSERRQQVNPRKLYMADHSLAAAFSPVGGADRGHYLENMVAVELARRSWPVAYYRTRSGTEVDFLTHDNAGEEILIQVAADVSAADVFEREARALAEAAAERPTARLILLSEVAEEHMAETASGCRLQVVPIWRWLLTSLPGV